MKISEVCSKDVINVNGKVSLCTLQNTIVGGGGWTGDIEQIILNLGTRWRLVRLCPGRFTPRERVPGTYWRNAV
jgi:hypothetical protein